MSATTMRGPSELGRRLARLLTGSMPARADCGWVLCYHLVGGGTASPVDTDAGVFVEQLDLLEGFACVVSLAELVRRARAGEWRERPLVAITFDDAYDNFGRRVLPLVVQRRTPVTLYVPVGFVNGDAPPPLSGADLAPLTWAEVRDLSGHALVTIGSHTNSHADLRRLRGPELEAEVAGSRARLEDRIGGPVVDFCYPRAHWDRRVERVVARTYDRAVIGGGRCVTSHNLNPHRLWRVSIRRDSPADLAAVLRGPAVLEEWVADIVRRRWRA